MNLKTYLRAIFPSFALTIGMFALPIFLTVYFVFTQYSNQFIATQDLSYSDVQSNWIGRLFLDRSWLDGFNRFMDFGFWGMLTLVMLIGLWAFASAKITIKNHYAQTDFKNFRESRKSWHRHFFVVIGLKIFLIFVFAYSVLAIIGRQIPQLSASVAVTLAAVNFETVKSIVLVSLAVVVYQYVIATCIKVFRHLQID